jgi:DNA-binding Lrp family transcriptional regulator
MRFDNMLDELDRKILLIILKDARAKYTTIAEQTDTTVGTVHNRVKRLIDEGIIRGFISKIDPKKIGFDISVLIELRIEGGHLKQIQKKYLNHNNVCAIYDITGDYDITLIGKFENTDELNNFIKKIAAEKYVLRTSTKLILDVVKEEFTPEI